VAVFMQGIVPAGPIGAVAKSSADTTSSDAVQAHASAKMARKTPDKIAFLNIYSVTAA
jgi:hypothetical protein